MPLNNSRNQVVLICMDVRDAYSHSFEGMNLFPLRGQGLQDWESSRTLEALIGVV